MCHCYQQSCPSASFSPINPGRDFPPGISRFNFTLLCGVLLTGAALADFALLTPIALYNAPSPSLLVVLCRARQQSFPPSRTTYSTASSSRGTSRWTGISVLWWPDALRTPRAAPREDAALSASVGELLVPAISAQALHSFIPPPPQRGAGRGGAASTCDGRPRRQVSAGGTDRLVLATC